MKNISYIIENTIYIGIIFPAIILPAYIIGFLWCHVKIGYEIGNYAALGFAVKPEVHDERG